MRNNRTYSTYNRLKIAGMCLAIFVLYFTNISLFSHCHIINGVTIVHSHFCTDDHTEDPYDSDSHTDNELTLIQNISNYIVESPTLQVALDVILTKTDFVFIIVDSHSYIDNQSNCLSLRGPPTTNIS